MRQAPLESSSPSAAQETRVKHLHVFDFLKKKTDTEPSKPGPFGHFYLQELINSGGMADIWLATDFKNDKPCAIRRLHPHLRHHSMAKKRFLQGCEVLRKLQDNEGIIGYVTHGKLDGQWYLAMEYVEGANLKSLRSNQEPVLMENVAQIVLDMAAALEHMHENGYMHLDFKPENVLVSRNGAVRLVDFDLAQQIPEKPIKTSKNPGTPSYMAPEQLSGQAIDQRVDVFAFGVAAYELLTGRKPFPGETAAEILRLQTDRSNFVALRQANPDLPASLEKVVLKCIETDPNRRYPFLSLLTRDLGAALYV